MKMNNWIESHRKDVFQYPQKKKKKNKKTKQKKKLN
jgi:hypothetical protein